MKNVKVQGKGEFREKKIPRLKMARGIPRPAETVGPTHYR